MALNSLFVPILCYFMHYEPLQLLFVALDDSDSSTD